MPFKETFLVVVLAIDRISYDHLMPTLRKWSSNLEKYSLKNSTQAHFILMRKVRGIPRTRCLIPTPAYIIENPERRQTSDIIQQINFGRGQTTCKYWQFNQLFLVATTIVEICIFSYLSLLMMSLSTFTIPFFRPGLAW